MFQLKKQVPVCFFLFFLLGILYANFSFESISDSGNIFSEYYLNRYRNMEFKFVEYMVYLLRIRMTSIMIVLAVSFTRFRKAAAWGYMGWTGFLAGFLMAAAVSSLGIKGSILCVIGIFPHFICYIPAYFVVWWYALSYPQNRWNSQKTVFVFATVLTGIVLEAYVNPVIVKGFLKIL